MPTTDTPEQMQIGSRDPMADQDTRNNLRLHCLLGSLCQQFNAAFINVQFYISRFFQGEEIPPTIFPHAAFAFTIFVILSLLQVKYQGKDKTPFESHPITIAIAITSLLIYGFAYGIEQRLSSNSRNRVPSSAINTIRCCMLLAGSLSLAATASFLFPDSVRPVLFVIYCLGSAGQLLYWAYERFTREHRESQHGWVSSQQLLISVWQFINRCFNEPRQRLPL